MGKKRGHHLPSLPRIPGREPLHRDIEPKRIIPHRTFQPFPQQQSKLFFECTLFLYSILALFLEYLNLYKTLWWLPKSHWHTTFKYHLMNPYVLSCIGLLLGIRVTKCFWSTITHKFDQFNVDNNSVFWSIVEYAVIKSPLGTMIFSSFIFSFSRIVREFGTISVLYLLLPILGYVLIFKSFIEDGLRVVWRKWRCSGGGYFGFITELVYFEMPLGPDFIDRGHSCEHADRKEYWREAIILHREFVYRCLCCLYTGSFTTYFAVFLPSLFVTNKTTSGLEQHYLTENLRHEFMMITVFATSVFLYTLHLFPMEFIDRLYKCACHLGYWVRIDHTQYLGDYYPPESYEETYLGRYHSGGIFFYEGKIYQAHRHPHYDGVTASPVQDLHFRVYELGRDPVWWIRSACIVQLALIAVQFYALVMATDWQHIFTLVMLMFANYLLFGKFLKDYVVMSHIYADSRKMPDGAPLPLHGRHIDHWGMYCPEPYQRVEPGTGSIS